MKFNSPAEVGRLYADKNAPIPILDLAVQAAARGCMSKHDYGMIAGCRTQSETVDGELINEKLGEALRANRGNLVHHPKSVVGPYMENTGKGAYLPDGIGIWMPRAMFQHIDPKVVEELNIRPPKRS